MKRNKEKLCKVLFKMIIIVVVMCFLGIPQTVQAAAKLAAPKAVKTAIASSTSIKIGWSRVTGASGYQIYQATSSKGTYKLVKTIAAGKYSYVNEKLTPGKTYYYKVRAYKTSGKSKVYGSYSKVIRGKITPVAVDNFKGNSTSYEGATLTWGTVKYVSGYRVYMATSSSGKYTLVDQTKSKSYKVSGLEPGKTYYFKVRGYILNGNSKVYGGFSSVITVKPILSVPNFITVTTGLAEGTIDINWSPSEGSEGYEVYQSSSKSGTYQLLTTVSEPGYTATGLDFGSTYYYKTRAYRLVDKTKVYSEYSTTAGGYVPDPNLTLVSLDQSDIWMVVGGTDQLIATISPQNVVNQELTWISSNEDVVVVDEGGAISAMGEGTATISVIVNESGEQAECNITVEKAYIKGIDVSKWQGVIDWSKVKSSGVEFAMIRASYGSSNLDPKFETNYQGAKDSGIAVGAYHYSHATTIEMAKIEVDFLIKTLEGKQFEYPICLDLEDKAQLDLDKKTLADIALVYFDTLTEAGYYPMLYSSKSWFTGKLYDVSLDVFDRWVAQWSDVLTYTGELGMWQYSATGSVSGIAGDVDLDISFIDYESRIRWLGLNGLEAL